MEGSINYSNGKLNYGVHAIVVQLNRKRHELCIASDTAESQIDIPASDLGFLCVSFMEGLPEAPTPVVACESCTRGCSWESSMKTSSDSLGRWNKGICKQNLNRERERLQAACPTAIPGLG